MFTCRVPPSATCLRYNPDFGARPIKRVVQRELETPLARGLLSGEYHDGDTISVRADLDAIRLLIDVVEQVETAVPTPPSAANSF